MERNVRYQMLRTEEDTAVSTADAAGATAGAMASSYTAPVTPMAASYSANPPSYSAVQEGATAMPHPLAPPLLPPNASLDYDQPPKEAYPPPDYTVATDLPTYEEVQRLKMEEEQRKQEELHIDPESLHHEDTLLGTDLIFFCSFFVAFLFNWIGFLLLMCFCRTIAGRYGALAGFGLSLAKWTLIVKHSTDLISADNSWLWWLILAFGVLICMRAVLQYIHVKREWRLLSRTAQEQLVYFY